MHAKFISSQILLTTLLVISIICEIDCLVNFLDFFKNFKEDSAQIELITDQCSATKQEEKLKCYWKILENELIHLLRAIKSESYGIFGFNSNTKALIFLKRIIDLTSKTTKTETSKKYISYQNHQYLNNSIINDYGIKWYDYYEIEDFERIVNKLSKINLGSYDIMNFKNENNIFEKNSKKLTIKLIVLSILYKQYSMDKIIYKKIIEDDDSRKNYTQNLLKALNVEKVILDEDINNLIKKLDIFKKEKKNKNNYLKNKLIFIMKYFKAKIIIYLDKTNNIFDNIRKKLYSRVLNYYLWVIILAKLFFICSRRLISIILILDHIIIYIFNNLEDYLFMLISLQFTFEMVLTLIQETSSMFSSLN